VIRPYVDLLRLPGALAFSSAGLLARMPMSMTGLGIVLLVSAESGSYALAGALAAAFAVSASLLSPIGSRLVDRYGQARLLPVLAGVGGLAVYAFAWAAVHELPVALLAVTAIVAGAFQPNIGAFVRARWSARLSGTPRLTTAFALESVLDELVFVVGPPLATILATAVAPASALNIAATLLIIGSALLAVQRGTQPLPSRHDDEPRATSAIRLPVVVIIGVIFLLLGGVFGATDVTVVAFAQQRDAGAMAGVLLALFAVGSLVGGLLYGTLDLPVPLPRQLWMSLAALAAGCALIPFVGTFWLLGALRWWPVSPWPPRSSSA
jgi:MFS family permease